MTVKINPMLEQFKHNRRKRESKKQIVVRNYGQDITLHIRPVSFADSMKVSTAMQMRAGAAHNGEINLNGEMMGESIMELIATHVDEIASLDATDLTMAGVDDHVDFVAGFFDNRAMFDVYRAVLDFGDLMRGQAEDAAQAAAQTAKN